MCGEERTVEKHCSDAITCAGALCEELVGVRTYFKGGGGGGGDGQNGTRAPKAPRFVLRAKERGKSRGWTVGGWEERDSVTPRTQTAHTPDMYSKVPSGCVCHQACVEVRLSESCIRWLGWFGRYPSLDTLCNPPSSLVRAAPCCCFFFATDPRCCMHLPLIHRQRGMGSGPAGRRVECRAGRP